jgi:solute carrier family 35 protein F1/2
MWGFLFNGIQSAALEWKGMKEVPWDGATIGLLAAFTCSMIILYTVSPLLYRLASSAYYNLSLLSSDFYGLLFGLFLYHYRPFWLYFIAFAIVIAGLITYFWSSTPQDQGFLDPKAPDYVQRRRGGPALTQDGQGV